MSKNHEKKQQHQDEKNILEWVVFYCSLSLIIGILGYLVYQALHVTPGSPDIAVVYAPHPSPHAPYRYHLTIQNDGHETAEEVSIEMVLQKDGVAWETGTMQLAYVPKESKREGWINFSEDPNEADSIYVRVVSYKKP